MNTLIKFLLIINIITLNQNTAFAAAAATEEAPMRPRRPNPMMAGLQAALMAERANRQQRTGAGSDEVCSGVGTGTAKAEKPKKPRGVNPFLDALSKDSKFGASRKEEYVVEGVGCAVARKESTASTGHSYKGAADPKALVPAGLMQELFAKLAKRSEAVTEEDTSAAAAFAAASAATPTPKDEDLMPAEETPAAAVSEGWVPDLSAWGVSMPTVEVPDFSAWGVSMPTVAVPDLSAWVPFSSPDETTEVLDLSKFLPSEGLVDLKSWAESLPDNILERLLKMIIGYDEATFTTAHE
tara:strand:+ start:19716 stop:20606 length:891 start_codon:yes stop_codon:yes gene_type:complete